MWEIRKMEKLKKFCNKYLKNYVVLLFVTAIVLDLIIETLARHSLIQFRNWKKPEPVQ